MQEALFFIFCSHDLIINSLGLRFIFHGKTGFVLSHLVLRDVFVTTVE